MLTSRVLTGLLASTLLALFASAQEPDRGQVLMINGDGINPMCLDGPAPTIDSMWRGTVDGTQIVGAQGAMLMLSGGPWLLNGGALNTDFGQILIDPAMAIYRLNRPLQGGRVVFGLPVPNDLTMVGQKFYMQSLVYGYQVMQLCNGLELTIGNPVLPPQDGGATE